jgi:HAD superfamily hydrolase (TIGR01459 family)
VSEPVQTLRLGAIAANYDALLCDAWGVIHDGASLAPGAAKAMTAFRRECGPLVILTNAPRPSSVIPPQLDRLGLPREAYDAIVTSGDATRREIQKRLPAPAYRIGPKKDDALFDGLPIDFCPLEDARFIICTGLVDDQKEGPEEYRGLLQAAAARGLEMICANPDIVVNWGGRLIWCAGALAEIYAELGGAVIYGGKPYPPIYDLARRTIDSLRKGSEGLARILVIGDGLKTDILGANKMGYDAVLVTGAGGVFSSDGRSLRARLDEAGVHVIGVMEALEW